MSVRWTSEATQQLINIKLYIAKDDVNAASKQIKKLILRAESLMQPPLLGRMVPEVGQAHIRELLERPYRIIYTIIDAQPWVLTIWHYRRILNSSDIASTVRPLK